jgi:hypothetical protein
MRAQCALQSSAYTAAELSYTIVCALHNRPTMLVEVAVQVATAARWYHNGSLHVCFGYAARWYSSHAPRLFVSGIVFVR